MPTSFSEGRTEDVVSQAESYECDRWYVGRVGGPSAGGLLGLIRTGRARTRRDLLEITGLSRSSVGVRVGHPVGAGYVNESGVEMAVRGRPSTVLVFNEGHGVVLAADLGVLENDANLMALGEFHSGLSSCPSLLFVKVSTGIGAGMVVDGRLVRGIHGGSGDIGHVRLANPESGPLCACGARGCLAASASGGAIARRLREQGRPVHTSREAVQLAHDRDPAAVALVREAGIQLGGVLATAVSLLNPQVLVIGGDLVELQEHFMVSLKEVLYQRTQPLATRDLHVRTSSLGDRAGIVGAANLVVEEVFSAESVDRTLAGKAWSLSGT